MAVEEGDTAALGGVVLELTLDVARAVHPLAGLVTVTEYKLGEVTVMDVVVAPVLHE